MGHRPSQSLRAAYFASLRLCAFGEALAPGIGNIPPEDLLRQDALMGMDDCRRQVFEDKLLRIDSYRKLLRVDT